VRIGTGMDLPIRTAGWLMASTARGTDIRMDNMKTQSAIQLWGIKSKESKFTRLNVSLITTYNFLSVRYSQQVAQSDQEHISTAKLLDAAEPLLLLHAASPTATSR